MAPLTATVQGMRQAPAGSIQLVAPRGSSAIVKHFFQRAAVVPEFGQRVAEVRGGGEERG